MSSALRAIFYLVLIVVVGCRKDSLSHTNELNGAHTWYGTVSLGGASYGDTFVASITVLDEKTILFERAVYDTMRLLSMDKRSRRLTFNSGRSNSYKSWYYDTIVYDFGNDVIFYKKEHTTAKHIVTAQYLSR